MDINKEKAILALVSGYVESYASRFSDRCISEYDDDDGCDIVTDEYEKARHLIKDFYK